MGRTLLLCLLGVVSAIGAGNERFEALLDRVKRGDWDRVAETIGTLLASGTALEREKVLALLPALPAPGLAVLVAADEPRAALALEAARTKNDKDAMELALGRYPHTAAAVSMAQWLGTYYMDRAQFALADRTFRKIERLPGLRAYRGERGAEATARSLALIGVKWAVALRRQGKDESEAVLDRLVGKTKLKLREGEVDGAELKKHLSTIGTGDPRVYESDLRDLLPLIESAPAAFLRAEYLQLARELLLRLRTAPRERLLAGIPPALHEAMGFGDGKPFSFSCEPTHPIFGLQTISEDPESGRTLVMFYQPNGRLAPVRMVQLRSKWNGDGKVVERAEGNGFMDVLSPTAFLDRRGSGGSRLTSIVGVTPDGGTEPLLTSPDLLAPKLWHGPDPLLLFQVSHNGGHRTQCYELNRRRLLQVPGELEEALGGDVPFPFQLGTKHFVAQATTAKGGPDVTVRGLVLENGKFTGRRLVIDGLGAGNGQFEYRPRAFVPSPDGKGGTLVLRHRKIGGGEGQDAVAVQLDEDLQVKGWRPLPLPFLGRVGANLLAVNRAARELVLTAPDGKPLHIAFPKDADDTGPLLAEPGSAGAAFLHFTLRGQGEILCRLSTPPSFPSGPAALVPDTRPSAAPRKSH